MMIVPIEKKHAREIAELHHKYTRSLLKDLGRRMCIVFYETELKSENNFGCVYVENSKVLGFILGTKNNSRLFKSPRILVELFFALCRKPILIKRFIFQIINKFPPAPEVAYIAVDLIFRGKGIGTQLLLTQHEAFRERGITYYEAKVDADNIPSLLLFKKLGAKIKNEFIENGIRRFRLQNKID